MKRFFFLGAVLSSFAVAAACSSGSSTGDGGAPDASNDGTLQQDSSKTDGGATDGGATDSGATDATTNDASDGGTSNQLTLTIDDYLGWCNVWVNDAGPSSGFSQIYQFAPDASVSLHGDTESSLSFYWGYWGNVNDAGMPSDGGQDLSKDVQFNITGNLDLHACCPDNGFPLSQCTF